MGNTTIYNKKSLFSYLIILLFSATLVACGTETDPPEETKEEDLNNQIINKDPVVINRTLEGTVAVGAPVAGTVQIIDVAGNIVETQSSAGGTYSVNLFDRRGPYLIRIIPNDGNVPVMYSYATGSGVANITPFTTLALYIAFNTDLETAFANWINTVNSWDRSDIEQAIAKLNAHFEMDLINAGVDPKTYDSISDPFTADQTGIDAFLDNYSVSVDFENDSYVITNNSSSETVPIDENIDTTGYYIGSPFIPEGTAVWEWTISYTLNQNGVIENQSQTLGRFPSDTIPLSKERFNETFWDLSFPTQTITCDDQPNVTCNLTWETTRIETDYTVTGNGEIGTVITGEAHYAWRFYGYIGSFAGVQNYDESNSWDYVWSWERVE